MQTFFAPLTALKVSSIKWSLACVKTWIVTSSGIKSFSIKSLTKSKSVFEADGNPTSISLNPVSNYNWKNLCFFSEPIGSIKAWLPSLKSTLHQIGFLEIIFPGHLRSLRSILSNGKYFEVFVFVFFCMLCFVCEKMETNQKLGQQIEKSLGKSKKSWSKNK